MFEICRDHILKLDDVDSRVLGWLRADHELTFGLDPARGLVSLSIELTACCIVTIGKLLAVG